MEANLWVHKNISQIILLSSVVTLNFKGAITKWTKPWSYVKLDLFVYIYMGIDGKIFTLERPLDGTKFMKNEPWEAEQA